MPNIYFTNICDFIIIYYVRSVKGIYDPESVGLYESEQKARHFGRMKSKRRQVSESFVMLAFLILSGGLQDAYTWFYRGEVFANAQTGNVVFFGVNLFSGNFSACLKYAIPVLSFFAGVLFAETIRKVFLAAKTVHWRQIVLAAEIAVLCGVAFIPTELNVLANALVSFVCAAQVQSFRKIEGGSFASTMCIGNIRSCAESLFAAVATKSKSALFRAAIYFGVIVLFMTGAGLGYILTNAIGSYAILASCGFLTIGFCMMFVKYEESDAPEGDKTID